MQIFERPDGVRVEAVPFESLDTSEVGAYGRLIAWLEKNGVETTWHPAFGTGEYEEDEEGGFKEIMDVEHLIMLKDDIEAGVDAAGVEHEIVIKDGYEVRVNVGEVFVLREGDVYTMSPEIFDAIFTAVITDDPEEWEWQMTSRLPYHKTLGYWWYKYNHDLISIDGGVTYWLESERPQFKPTAETIYTSEKKEANA